MNLATRRLPYDPVLGVHHIEELIEFLSHWIHQRSNPTDVETSQRGMDSAI
jgi:hypothetical protein